MKRRGGLIKKEVENAYTFPTSNSFGLLERTYAFTRFR